MGDEEKKAPSITSIEPSGVETPLPKIGEGGELLTEEPKPLEPGEISPELQELMTKKGFKDVGDLAKALNESEKKITELSQDARLRSMIPTETPARVREKMPNFEIPELTDDPANMTKEELNAHLAKQAEAVEKKLRWEYGEAEKDRQHERLAQDVVRLAREEPEDFVRLRNTMRELSTYPQYKNASVDTLFKDAKRYETEGMEKRKEDVLKSVGLEGEDIPAIKALLAKTRPGSLSSGPGANPNVGGTGKLKDSQIIQNILGADMLDE